MEHNVVWLVFLLYKALDIYLYILIANVIMSWLIAFDVLNTRNKFVYKVWKFLNMAVDPILSRLRKIIPPLGSIDFTPLVVVFGIAGIQNMLLGILR